MRSIVQKMTVTESSGSSWKKARRQQLRRLQKDSAKKKLRGIMPHTFHIVHGVQPVFRAKLKIAPIKAQTRTLKIR